jgi:hypothetical protein
MQAATPPTPATPADLEGGAAVGELGSTVPKVATGAQAAAEAAQTIADRPASAFLADVEAQKAALGPNVGQDEFRKQAMSERVNAADEAKRLRNMRLVEFFSTWGSTPGPTLVAGMEALKKSVPSFITDEKDQKKARQESDKLIYTLDEATRQEKLGNIKEATALKEKAAERAMHLQQYLTTQQTSAASDASRERASKLTAELHLRGEELRSQASRADRASALASSDKRHSIDQYNVASDSERRTLADIEKARSAKDYQELQRKANYPDTVTGPAKTQRDEAIASLIKIDASHATRAKDAARRTNMLEKTALGTDRTDAPTDKGISKAAFDKLPSGASFTAPDGTIRTKP